MKELFRFAVAYCIRSAAPAAIRSARRRWSGRGKTGPTGMRWTEARRRRLRVHGQAGAPFYCFHDRDVSGEGDDSKRRTRSLTSGGPTQNETGRDRHQVLWGTANLFSHPGSCTAATSCNADVFAYAAAQVKKALEVTHELGGVNYVFWVAAKVHESVQHRPEARDRSPREVHAPAVDHARKIGFKAVSV